MRGKWAEGELCIRGWLEGIGVCCDAAGPSGDYGRQRVKTIGHQRPGCREAFGDQQG